MREQLLFFGVGKRTNLAKAEEYGFLTDEKDLSDGTKLVFVVQSV